MSTPLVWIGFPLLVGFVLLFLQRWKVEIAIAGTLVALTLAGMARRVSFGDVIFLGPWSFTLQEQFTLAGRQFVLANADRPLLVMLYTATAFLLCGSIAARVHRRFAPLGLMVIAILTAALSIEPISYAALLIELAVLLCVLILSPPGHPVSKGVLRFLIFQTLGILFILLAGWLLSDLGAASENIAATTRATLMLGMGFGFLFAVFPLYTWVPMLLEDTHPYAAVFVFSMIFGGSTLYLLGFLEYYHWLQESLDIFAALRFVGVLMVATGGAWAAFQRHLGRVLGYAVVIEVGYTLLSVGIQNDNLHYAMLLPRILSLGVWALALAVLRSYSADLRFKAVQGMARRFPIAGAALLLAQFSLAGLPLLAGFPVLLVLWEQLAATSTAIALWSFLGSIGLMAGGLRSLAVLVMGPQELPWDEKEDWLSRIFLSIGMTTIFLVGLFPQWFFPMISDLASGFGFLQP